MIPTSANIITVLGIEMTARALEVAIALLWTAGTCVLAFYFGRGWERALACRELGALMTLYNQMLGRVRTARSYLNDNEVLNARRVLEDALLIDTEAGPR